MSLRRKEEQESYSEDIRLMHKNKILGFNIDGTHTSHSPLIHFTSLINSNKTEHLFSYEA